MRNPRSIKALFLVSIYCLLLLHDIVPHTHAGEEVAGVEVVQMHSHSHSHSGDHHSHDHDHDHDHHHHHGSESEQSIWDFLKNLLHNHAEISDANHHDLVYKSAPQLMYSVEFLADHTTFQQDLLSLAPPKRTDIFIHQFYWQDLYIQGWHSLRAPPSLT